MVAVVPIVNPVIGEAVYRGSLRTLNSVGVVTVPPEGPEHVEESYCTVRCVEAGTASTAPLPLQLPVPITPETVICSFTIAPCAADVWIAVWCPGVRLEIVALTVLVTLLMVTGGESSRRVIVPGEKNLEI